MGSENIAVAVVDEKEARATVKRLVGEGAVVIKIALEPGGETGAPWTSHHHEPAHHGSHHLNTTTRIIMQCNIRIRKQLGRSYRNGCRRLSMKLINET